MSEALNLFADSYLKRLKRPELFNFQPDQAFGANMVHRSEEQNPWANRNQDNAKYGNLGGNNNKVVQGPEFTANPSAPGGFTQIANGASAGGQSGLDSIIGAITKPVGEYVGKNVAEWLNPIPTIGDIGNKAALAIGGDPTLTDFASKMIGVGENPLGGFDPTMGKAGDALTGIGKEMTQGSTDMLKGAIEGGGSVPFNFDPVSMGMSAIPAVSKLFGIKGDSDLSRGIGAASSVGAAALQGGLNPISDIGAVMSLVKLFGGLFG